MANSLHDLIIVECDENRYAVWRVSDGRRTSFQEGGQVLPIGSAQIEEAIDAIGYGGQQVLVVLHPPCVCLKTYPSGSNDPAKWLSSHLAEVSPPINRRELVMAYSFGSSGQIVVAFVRRRFMMQLVSQLHGCHLSVKGILPAAAIAMELTRSSDDHSVSRFDGFKLCRYHLDVVGGSQQVMPLGQSEPVTESLLAAISLKATIASLLTSKSKNQLEVVDFLSQTGTPKSMRTYFLSRLMLAELLLLLTVLITLGWHAALTPFIDLPRSGDIHRATLDRLEKIQSENRMLADRLQGLAIDSLGRMPASRFLYSIAMATPDRVCLQSLSLVPTANKSLSGFNLIGYSLATDAAIEMIDLLRRARGIRSASLASNNLIERVPQTDNRNRLSRMNRFEIVGEYDAQ